MADEFIIPDETSLTAGQAYDLSKQQVAFIRKQLSQMQARGANHTSDTLLYGILDPCVQVKAQLGRSQVTPGVADIAKQQIKNDAFDFDKSAANVVGALDKIIEWFGEKYPKDPTTKAIAAFTFDANGNRKSIPMGDLNISPKDRTDLAQRITNVLKAIKTR